MLKRLFTIFITVFTMFLFYACKKPKPGKYVLTVEGEEYFCNTSYNTSTSPVTGTTTTGTRPYLLTTTLHLNYSGINELNFDEMLWKKNGSVISYLNSYDNPVGLGAYSKATESYDGQIISQAQMSGNVISTYTFNYCCFTSQTSTVTGTFKIERK